MCVCVCVCVCVCNSGHFTVNTLLSALNVALWKGNAFIFFPLEGWCKAPLIPRQGCDQVTPAPLEPPLSPHHARASLKGVAGTVLYTCHTDPRVFGTLVCCLGAAALHSGTTAVMWRGGGVRGGVSVV